MVTTKARSTLFLLLFIGSPAQLVAECDVSDGKCPASMGTSLPVPSLPDEVSLLQTSLKEVKSHAGTDGSVMDPAAPPMASMGDAAAPPLAENVPGSLLQTSLQERSAKAELDAEVKSSLGDVESSSCNENWGSMTNGQDYRGCRSETKTGRTCQRWDVHTPHKHAHITPENKGSYGIGYHNDCRNPDGEPSIWCYTTSSNKRWELCVPSTPVGHNCNCGPKIGTQSMPKGYKKGVSLEWCNSECNKYSNCKSFGYWTQKDKGKCVLFSKACRCDGICTYVGGGKGGPTSYDSGWRNEVYTRQGGSCAPSPAPQKITSRGVSRCYERTCRQTLCKSHMYFGPPHCASWDQYTKVTKKTYCPGDSWSCEDYEDQSR